MPSKNTLKLTRNCEANLLKVGKSQKVFSFPSYLQKNALNHSPSTFFMKWNSFWDLPTSSRIASLFLAYFSLMFWKGGGLFYLYYLNLHKKVSEQSFSVHFDFPFSCVFLLNVLERLYLQPFNLHLDFWKWRSWEIKVCFKP